VPYKPEEYRQEQLLHAIYMEPWLGNGLLLSISGKVNYIKEDKL
jgi:hypothetical protein